MMRDSAQGGGTGGAGEQSWMRKRPGTSLLYEAIVRSPIVHEFVNAFHQATGVAMRISTPGHQRHRVAFGRQENPFCGLIAKVAGGCRACEALQVQLQHRLEHKLAPQTARCVAGLTDLAVPIIVAGDHVATLWAGQILLEPPTPRQFERIRRVLVSWGLAEQLPQLRSAYFQVPVRSATEHRAIVHLLAFFAQYVGENASRWLVARQRHDPEFIGQAKAFIHSRCGDEITLREVAHHVRLSPWHFSRRFKQCTGMSFVEYVNRVRVENAKQHISAPHARVSDAAFAAGFQSVSQFERMFRRFTGVAPSLYRSQ